MKGKRTDNSNRDLVKTKLAKIAKNDMKEREIDAWIVFTREGNRDPLSEDFGLSDITWRSAAIICENGSSYAIVGSFDAKQVERTGLYDEVYGYGSEGPFDLLSTVARKNGFKKVAIDESDDFGLADGISSSMKRYLKGAMPRNVEFVSSEDLVISLRGRLLPEELSKVKKAITLTEDILETAQNRWMKEGKTDYELFTRIQEETVGAGADFAWSRSMCPSVCVGTIEPQHSGYDNVPLRAGKMLRIDFGVKLNGYCADLQRDYFFGSPPKKLREDFQVARQANDAAIKKLSANARGFEVDRAGRRIVLKSGFKDFAHGLGHTLGRTAHEIGPVLAPQWRKRYGYAMDKKIGRNVVITIEPTIFSKFGGINLEQDVLVDDSGKTVELSKPMEEMIQV
jgi:Xaa-Pro aminopeptidase